MAYAKVTKTTTTTKKTKKKKTGGNVVRCPECGGDGVIRKRKKSK